MAVTELCALSVKPPERLIEPWLEAGDVVMVHSPPGQSKTLLLMQVGMALARGESAFGDKWEVNLTGQGALLRWRATHP